METIKRIANDIYNAILIGGGIIGLLYVLVSYKPI
jgi:hypothetical protein